MQIRITPSFQQNSRVFYKLAIYQAENNKGRNEEVI